MRTPLLAGNWKLQAGTRAEARSLAAAVARECRGLTNREVMVAPPFPSCMPKSSEPATGKRTTATSREGKRP